MLVYCRDCIRVRAVMEYYATDLIFDQSEKQSSRMFKCLHRTNVNVTPFNIDLQLDFGDMSCVQFLRKIFRPNF